MASVPTGLTPAALRPRTPYHHPSLPPVLLWSEKSGCTSLLTWFLHHIGKLDEARAHSDWIHDWEHEVMKADPDYDRTVIDALHDGAPAIKLVRDPFDRAVSSFFMMSVLGDESGHFTVDLRRSLRGWLYGDPEVPYGFGFVDFLRWMCTLDPADLNTHLGPQSTVLEDRLHGVELIRLDEFDAGIRALEERFDLPPSDLAAVSSSNHHTVRSGASVVDPAALNRVHFPIPTPPDWHLPPSSAFADEETVALVGRLFAEDYERYGFDLPPTHRRVRTQPVPAARTTRDEEAGTTVELVDAMLDERRTTLEVRQHIDDVPLTTHRTTVTTIDDLGSLDEQRFETVVLADALATAADPRAVLSRALDLVLPDGDVVLVLPNGGHGDVRLHLLEGRSDVAVDGGGPPSVPWWTRATIRSLLDGADLVAIDLDRLRSPLGTTDTPVRLHVHSAATREFVAADRDHDTTHFVVRAQRLGELAEGVDATLDDALAAPAPKWPMHDDEVEELRRYAAGLRTALDAWESSRTARVLATVRSVPDRLRRSPTRPASDGG